MNKELINKETARLKMAGAQLEEVVATLLSYAEFSALDQTSRVKLAQQAREAYKSELTVSAPRQVEAKLQPQFPESRTMKTRGGVYEDIPEKNHPDNLKYLICDFLNVKPELNLLKNRTYTNNRLLSDSDVSNIRNRCREFGLNDSKDFVLDVIDELSKENTYHPLLRALEPVTWDSQDHIKNLFETLTVAAPTPDRVSFYYTCLRRFLIGAVAKIMEPGAQNLTLVLKSPQGAGKSRWLAKLCSISPEIYGEGAVNTENKDHLLRHLNYIVWHIPEIDGSMRKADAAALKDYLTASDIAAREPYARFDRIGKSCLSFVASVNSSTFLVDDTGSRRFLVLDLDDVEANHDVDVLQVWAQAMALYKSGERYWFNKEEIKVINEFNEDYQVRNHVDHIATKIEPGTDWLSGVEIFAAFFNKSSPNNGELAKLGSILSRLGIEKQVIRDNGLKVTKYKVKKPTNFIL